MSLQEKEIVVGGQAVIEGVMMRTPNAYAVAVRQPDGTIVHTGERLPKWGERVPMLRLPVLRGAAVLLQSMALGIKALNYSASKAFPEREKRTQNEVALSSAVVSGESGVAAITSGMPGLVTLSAEKDDDSKSHRKERGGAVGSIIFALFFNAMLFIVLPLLITNVIFVLAGWDDRSTTQVVTTNEARPAEQQVAAQTDASHDAGGAWYSRAVAKTRELLKPVRPGVLFNLIDGTIRMIFFLLMIFSFSLVKDIRRVFEYHGAEHKTVWAWEAGLPLNVESARIQPRQHPRCGTSFLMVVMLVSVLVFSVVSFNSIILNILVRIALIPVLAGISYEIIRLSAKKEGGFIFKFITRPGLWLQLVTTKEPDDAQLEVAIIALSESLKLEPQPQLAVAALAPLS